MNKAKPTTVEEYIALFNPPTKGYLEDIRSLILKIVPDAAESISYGMPAYKYKKKPLIYFAGYDRHIGVYATPNAHTAFAEELKVFKQGKGSVQFPLDQELPMDLIKRMVIFNKTNLD
ncbi:MAG: DUF1801 domain-containing protein [Flavobacteriales bacterium]|nr:DUF1801 domain-containing protein [Flavobacteriales bacterium]MCB9197260.1 DUF1801 domain-containing protein [Flavobacteriales bacterium]